MKLPWQLRTFSAKGTALFVLLLLFMSMSLGVTSFFTTSDLIEQRALANLTSLASAKQLAIESEIDRYFVSQKTFLTPDILQLVTQLQEAQGRDREQILGELEKTLNQRLLVSDRLACAQILGPDLAPLARTDHDHGPHLSDKPEVMQAARSQTNVSRPYLEGSSFFIYVSAPLRDEDGALLGVVVLRRRADLLMTLVGDQIGLGETGETVLGHLIANHVVYITPLRFAADPSTIPPISIESEWAYPMIAATTGQAGLRLNVLDYRKQLVVAAFRPLAGSGWGLVVKQDMDEVNGPLLIVRNRLVFIFMGILVLSILIVYPSLKTLTYPLRTLTQVTERIASGDLEARVPEQEDPEMEILAASFNRMAERLAKAHRKSEKRSQELQEFAYAVSHDLKAPLRGLAGISEWLQEDLGDKVEGESIKHLVWMRERVLEMDNLITGLLDYTRVGRVRHGNMQVDVGNLLARVLDTLAPPEGIKVFPSTELPTLPADATRMTQVFQNLIGNAIQHHPGPVGEVRISAQDLGEFWEFSVADDGLGIDPQYHDQVFKIFARLSGERNHGSTGIGLAIVTKIVQDVGGRVWVESGGVPGMGSDFRFTWPKEEPEEESG